ncbi:hypothetical protein LXA43DRAFT_904325, partial [Ganoderma leucocontextum]
MKFDTYRALAEPKRVWLGDDRYILATGVGSMYLDLEGEDSITQPALFTHVYHVSELHGNLASISALIERGHAVTFDTQGCNISGRDGKLLGRATLINGLYVLKGTAATPD